MKRILFRSAELLFLALLYCGVAFLCRDRRERQEEQQSVPPIELPPAADAPVPIPEPTPVRTTTIPISTLGESILVHPKVSRAIVPRPECGQEPEVLIPVPLAQALPPVEQPQAQYQCNCRRCRRRGR